MSKSLKLTLPKFAVEQLINTPETGMGYHIVDIHLKDGRILKDQIVLNCSVIKIDILNTFNAAEIINIIIK